MCTFGFKLTQSFIALRFWHNVSLFFLYVKHNMSTNIDTTPILTCTFILKDEHQIFELLESINCTGVYIKNTWRRNLRFLFKIIDDLQSSFRGLNILQISDMLAFKQSGEKLNCTLSNMIKLIKIVCILLGVEVFICWIKFKRHLLVHSNSDLMYCT